MKVGKTRTKDQFVEASPCTNRSYQRSKNLALQWRPKTMNLLTSR
jgi:hypothetical protein